MIITKLNIEELNECSISIEKDAKQYDVLSMLKYLDSFKCHNHLYINWDKHLFSKNLFEVLN